jgi:tRNA pseudouridine13 synthase
VKLRRRPEDFRVDELTDVQPTGSGPFALYRLTKQSLGTPEAIDAVLRRWKLPRDRVAYGGMKDRHAVTQQHVTIHRGPRHDLRQSNLTLEYLGQVPNAFKPEHIRGNRFTIVMRSLSADELSRAEAAAAELQHDGLPNYFDDQRFGSVPASGEFIARAWIQGDYERALQLALAEHYPFDSAGEREQKRILRDHWRAWPECKRLLERSHRRSIVTYLCDRPGDFRGAWARVNADLRRLYLSAFQSDLWNRVLSAFLRETCRPDQLVDVELKTTSVPFFAQLDDETRRRVHETSLPLPSARTHLDAGPTKELVDRCLGEVGLTMREIRVKYPRDSFFSKGVRTAAVSVDELEATSGEDELEPGRKALTLRFTLPRGAYATILVKRLTVGAGE